MRETSAKQVMIKMFLNDWNTWDSQCIARTEPSNFRGNCAKIANLLKICPIRSCSIYQISGRAKRQTEADHFLNYCSHIWPTCYLFPHKVINIVLVLILLFFIALRRTPVSFVSWAPLNYQNIHASALLSFLRHIIFGKSICSYITGFVYLNHPCQQLWIAPLCLSLKTET